MSWARWVLFLEKVLCWQIGLDAHSKDVTGTFDFVDAVEGTDVVIGTSEAGGSHQDEIAGHAGEGGGCSGDVTFTTN